MIDYSLSNSHSCGDKRAYPTQREAVEANKRHIRGIKKKVEKLHAYKCFVCRQWHLGHSARKNKGHNGTRKKDTVRDNGLPDEY